MSRQRAADLALGVNEIVINRDELDKLHDDLYMLAAAVEDTERDLAGKGELTSAELRDSLAWLLEAAKPLHDREISAPTGTPPITS